MGADKWATAVVGVVGVLAATAVALYVNGPWRKRIVDEIAMRDHVLDKTARLRLDVLIERDMQRYARRRSENYTRLRVLFASALLLWAAGLVTGPVLKSNIGFAFSLGAGIVLGFFVVPEFLEKRSRLKAEGAFTTPPSSGPARTRSKTRRR